MKLSVVTPVYNEEKNITSLHKELSIVLPPLSSGYEIIAVDDASIDGSADVLGKIAKNDPRFKVIRLRAHRGQTAALAAGIAAASGDVIILIDSDLENNPQDIAPLLKKLEEGYDVVSGWRKKRWQEQALTRRIPSQLANWLISKISGIPLHDYGCTLKAYRKEVFGDILLYGEMHRIIPAYLAWRGARVAEIPVDHRPRRYGKSNYGISRAFRVLLDLIFLKFFNTYLSRPMHFFGGLGFILIFFGFITMFGAMFIRLTYHISLIQTPLPTLAAMLVIVGVQLIVMGILAELLMRTYYESQGKTPYVIKEKINL